MDALELELRSESLKAFNAARQALEHLPKERAVTILEDLAKESKANLRSRAITELGRISKERCEPLTIRFLSDKDPLVRVSAVYSVGKLEMTSGVPLLIDMLQNDPDDVVRSWTATVLGQLGTESALAALRVAASHDRGTDHEGRPIREIAVKAISKIEERTKR